MHIFNTSSKRKELLGNKVKIFVCGPTLYDYLHLGHARLFIVVDTLVKYLRLSTDTYLLVNVTDVDPKIDERARDEGFDPCIIVSKYSEEMIKDLRLIDALDSIDAFAYVSNYIDYANYCIDRLIDKGYAYRLVDRVYFDIYHAYRHGYGMLSCSSIDEVISKPLDMLKGKRNIADILLQYRKGKWYPYWHMQDTSVALANYSCNYDIHVGSKDLIYPHHEAYIAQCNALTNGNCRVGSFMHLGLLKVNGRKMSKSYRNVVRLRDMVVRYGYKALRLYMLAEHYREDMDFDIKRLEIYKEIAMRIDTRLIDSKVGSNSNGNSSHLEAFNEYMSDDLATDKVIDMLYNSLEDISARDLKVIADVLL